MSPIGEQQRMGSSGGGPKKAAGGRSRPPSHNNKNADSSSKGYSYRQGLQTTEVQNVASHRIFVFGSGEDDLVDMESGSIELNEIRSRNRKEPTTVKLNEPIDDLRKSHYIDHNLEPDDTLAKLSLKFGCTVTQLKQMNGIYSDQDFFARKALKIPVFAHSVLWEATGNRKNSLDSRIDQLKEITRSHSESSLRHTRENMMYERERVSRSSVNSRTDYSYSDDDSTEYRDSEHRNLLNGRPKNSSMLNDTNNLYEEYLELVDKDIQDVSNRVQSKSEVGEIGSHSVAYMQPDLNETKKEEKLGQAGWISYKGILLIVCTVAVLLPVMYILYFMVLKKSR